MEADLDPVAAPRVGYTRSSGLDSRLMGFSSARTRHLVFGALCVLLVIVAGITASWIPLAILLVVGAVFIGRGVTMNKS